MRQVQPEFCAVARVKGSGFAPPTEGTASARSQGSQFFQSCQGICISPPISSERKPLQSMKKAVSALAPADEINADLDGGTGLAHEIRLIDTEAVIEHLYMRESGFADTDRSDLIRFDEGEIVGGRRQQAGQSGGGHPTRRPS